MEATKDKVNLSERYSIDKTDRLILKLLIDNPGIKQGEIAAELGLTRNAVNQRIQKPSFNLAFQYATATTDELLVKGKEVMVRRLIEIMKSGNPKEATEAAKVFHVVSTGEVPGRLAPSTPRLEGIIFETQVGKDGIINRMTQEVHALTDGKDRKVPPKPVIPEVMDIEASDVSQD